MIVNPIEWTAMALAKTRFEVIHADAACWPLRDSRVLVVCPDFTAAGGGRAKVHGNKGRLSGGMGSVCSERPVFDVSRVIAMGGLPDGE